LAKKGESDEEPYESDVQESQGVAKLGITDDQSLLKNSTIQE